MNKETIIKPGYKKTSVGIIPEDWEVKRLEEVLIILGGNAFKSSDAVTIGIKWLKIANVGKEEIKTDILEYLPSTFEDKFKRFIIRKGDYVMALTRPLLDRQLKIAQIKQNTTWLLNQRVAKLSCNKNENYIDYFINILKQPFYCYQLEILMAGTDPPNLSLADFRMIKLPIPPLPEQKAIADCLSTWDKAIEKQNQLIHAKKEFKKGLMQRFFNGELSVKDGKVVKAKEGEDFTGDWEEIELGKIGETFNGLTGKTKDDFGKGKPYVSYLNVFNSNKIDETTEFDFVSIDKNENQTKVKYGDLLFTTSSETPDEVGMASVVLIDSEELYLNSFCFGLKLKDFEKLIPEFAAYLLRSSAFREEMYKLAQGSTRFNLSKAGFKKIKVKLPKIDNQSAIAQVLQSADKETELLEQKLAQMQLQKKGLMQALLTGEKRLV